MYLARMLGPILMVDSYVYYPTGGKVKGIAPVETCHFVGFVNRSNRTSDPIKARLFSILTSQPKLTIRTKRGERIGIL